MGLKGGVKLLRQKKGRGIKILETGLAAIVRGGAGKFPGGSSRLRDLKGPGRRIEGLEMISSKLP